MRVIVTVTEGAAQELFRELDRVPVRERAERIRNLATVGLVLAQRPEVLTQVPRSMTEVPFPESAARQSNRHASLQAALKSQLTQDLGNSSDPVS